MQDCPGAQRAVFTVVNAAPFCCCQLAHYFTFPTGAVVLAMMADRLAGCRFWTYVAAAHKVVARGHETSYF